MFLLRIAIIQIALISTVFCTFMVPRTFQSEAEQRGEIELWLDFPGHSHVRPTLWLCLESVPGSGSDAYINSYHIPILSAPKSNSLQMLNVCFTFSSFINDPYNLQFFIPQETLSLAVVLPILCFAFKSLNLLTYTIVKYPNIALFFNFFLQIRNIDWLMLCIYLFWNNVLLCSPGRP